MKEKILKCLFDSGDKVISGVQISSELGISRVAVWKHIKRLNEEGYEIISSSKGYKLRNPGDLLAPFCFDTVKYHIHFFPKISSTMDKARDMARNNARNMTIVVAEEQTKGRGRLNRIWLSSKGGLWFTIILKPDFPPVLSFRVNFAASLCLAKTLIKLFKINATVKWPNDILVNGKKLAGLLSEMETKADMISFVNIGIGLNVNNSPEKREPNAVSIKNILNREVSRRKILITFLDEFKSELSGIFDEDPHDENKDIINRWKKYTSTIGRQVTIETSTSISHGLAVDVDSSGALILQQDNGEQKKIIYGDCFYRQK